jgi:structural maintenance of chromosome 2
LDLFIFELIKLILNYFYFFFKFIIVSLKDGMYTNANVLFRTRLIDGVSTIERFDTTNKKNQNEKSDQNNGKTK